jgi:hypothetical protein
VEKYNPQACPFDFANQSAREVYVVSKLLPLLRRALPGWEVRELKGVNEQRRGDIEIRRGTEAYTIELKIESYANTLFLELMQFRLGTAGGNTARYWPSWAFTTTADWMMYFSLVSGQLLLAPRQKWLDTGLRLADLSQMTSFHNCAAAIRPNVTFNASSNKLTAGASGLGMRTGDWLDLYARSGGDPTQVVFVDMTGLLEELRRDVRNEESLTAFLKSRGIEPDNQKWWSAKRELENIATRPAPARHELKETERTLALHKMLCGTTGGNNSLEVLMSTAATKGAEQSREPLLTFMWEHLAANMTCVRLQRQAWTDALVSKARAVNFSLAHDKLEGLKTMAPEGWGNDRKLLLAEDYGAGASLPGREHLAELFSADETLLDFLRGEYLTQYSHPPAASR